MSASQNKSLRILLIDDDALDRHAVVRALHKSNHRYEIEQAATAKEGLTLAAQKQFDAILLDYLLPDQNGIDTLKQLRNGTFEAVAVLILSRHEDETIAERSLDAGAQDFLLKDEVTSARLTRAVIQAHHRHQIQEELRTSREQLRDLSEHDPLTGLLNRRGFEVALSEAISSAQRRNENIALLLLDLDDFKTINDTLGHDTGDVLLKRIARRLKSVIRNNDKLCRLGGDEFVILMQDLHQDEEPLLLADRIFNLMQLPIELGSTQHNITASIGIAVLSDYVDKKIDLLKCADVAMYQAKKNGRNQSYFYSSTLQDAIESKARIKYDLKNAVEREEFRLYYQAQINAKNETLEGMEALIRWQHPSLGLLAPAAFLHIAEETGLIIDIGNWVLRNACSQLKQWQLKYPLTGQNISIAVNLSALQLRQENLSFLIRKILVDTALSPQYLELEITESALISDTRGTVALLESIVSQGVQLSLDDFGTGYSSLDHLKLFPISVIKIDRGFISAVGTELKGEKLLAAIIAFAKTLEMTVVTEGIETKEQADFCTHHGCDLLQGYYYSKPIAADEFEAKFLMDERPSIQVVSD
jgi:diguanylate cyclase